MKYCLYIIGSGVLGLCTAEYFSRNENYSVTVISNDHPLSGSRAAAANLATKGQQYARDSHFELKLKAKKIYKNWFTSLLQELNINDHDFIQQNLNDLNGLDIFATEEERNKHLLRVQQDTEQLRQKNLSTKSILPFEKNKIIYENEMWINASELLNLLNKVLIRRKVLFIQKTLTYELFEEIYQNKNAKIIFCTGAWTTSLLEKLNLPIPKSMQKSVRLTLGSTFFCSPENIMYDSEKFAKNDHQHSLFKNFSLIEKISSEEKMKLTFSGNKEKLFISSTSVKENNSDILNSENKDDFDDYLKNLKQENINFLNFLKNSEGFPDCPVPKNSEQNENLDSIFQDKKGIRIGFGHKEIIIEQIKHTQNYEKGCLFVCAGAHKSGFLFGPVIGPKIESLF